MKKKIFFAGLLAAVMSMMTSCVVIFPETFNKMGCVEITTPSSSGCWVSEVSYRTYHIDDNWIAAWDDGKTYEYRSVEGRAACNTTSNDVITCYMPEGLTDIRVTMIFYEGYGRYTYEDRIFKNQTIDSMRTLKINLIDYCCNGYNIPR